MQLEYLDPRVPGRVWRQHILYLDVLLQPVYQIIQKVLNGAYNQRLCTKSRLLYKLFCHVG